MIARSVVLWLGQCDSGAWVPDSEKMGVAKHRFMRSKGNKQGRRTVIGNVALEAGGGRHPVQRVSGKRNVVGADTFADARDVLPAALLVRPAGDGDGTETPLKPPVNDRWPPRAAADVL